MFTFVAISFNYALTGSFKEYQRDGGTQVVIKTVNMEPYRIGGDNPSDDLIRLICEIVLLVWIFNYVSSLIREMCEIYFKVRHSRSSLSPLPSAFCKSLCLLLDFQFLHTPWSRALKSLVCVCAGGMGRKEEEGQKVW